MNVLLSYPRSGSNLIFHMLEKCRKRPYKTHRIDFFDVNGEPCFSYKSDKEFPKVHALLLLVRDYREAPIRQIWHENEKVTNQMVDRMVTGDHRENIHSIHLYFKNLRVYDSFTNPKILVYYEDIIKDGLEAFRPVAKLFGADLSTLNWDESFAHSLELYRPPKMSGGKLKFHQYKIEDMDYYNNRILSLDIEMVNKYLKRYIE